MPAQASPGRSGSESTVAGAERFKRFPPRWGGLCLPVSSRSLALAGLAMYPACKPLARFAVRAARVGIRLLGPRALPGRAVSWNIPPVWKALEETWAAELGPFDGIVVYHRVPTSRSGVAVLLALGEEPFAFVKCRPEGDELARERDALGAVARERPDSFVAPEAIGFGETEGWTWIAQTPLASELHHPPRDPDLDRIVEEIQLVLSDLPRDPGVPDHWRPMHGDFTPWNLRSTNGGEALTLVDWEDAGWGPPGADRVLYCAVETALGLGSRSPDGVDPEAIEYWRDEIGSRGGSRRDDRLARQTLAALAGWDERGGVSS